MTHTKAELARLRAALQQLATDLQTPLAGYDPYSTATTNQTRHMVGKRLAYLLAGDADAHPEKEAE